MTANVIDLREPTNPGQPRARWLVARIVKRLESDSLQMVAVDTAHGETIESLVLGGRLARRRTGAHYHAEAVVYVAHDYGATFVRDVVRVAHADRDATAAWRSVCHALETHLRR